MNESLAQVVLDLKDEIALFQELDDKDVETIVPYILLKTYEKGDTLFHEGDSGDFVGFITEGTLEVKKQTDFKGKQIVIALLNKGSFVGELSLTDESKRSASVVALEKSRVVILNNDALLSLEKEHPHVAVKIIKGLNKVLAIRLRKAIERLTHVF